MPNLRRDVQPSENVTVSEVRSQGGDNGKISDFLRENHEISIHIEDHLKQVEKAHQDIMVLKKHLDSFTEQTTEFETHKQDIRRTFRDADQAFEDFNILCANEAGYKSAFEKFDKTFDELYHEIQKKTRAHIEQKDSDIKKLKSELSNLEPKMKAKPTEAELDQFLNSLEQTAKVTESLNKKLAEPNHTEEIRQLKDRLSALEAPDFKVQSHYYNLEDAMHKLSTSKDFFSSIADIPKKIEENLKLIGESYALWSKKATKVEEKEILFQKSREVSDDLAPVQKAYEEYGEQNKMIIEEVTTLNEDIGNCMNNLRISVRNKSPFYPVDLTKPMNDDPTIKPVDITKQNSCAIYSVRSLLDLIGVKTDERQVAKDLNLGKYGQGTRPNDMVAGLNGNEHYPVHATLFEESLTAEKAQAEIGKGNILVVNMEARGVRVRHGIGIGGMTKDMDLNKTFYHVYDNLTSERASCLHVPDYYINNNSYSYIVIEDRKTKQDTDTTSSAK